MTPEEIRAAVEAGKAAGGLTDWLLGGGLLYLVLHNLPTYLKMIRERNGSGKQRPVTSSAQIVEVAKLNDTLRSVSETLTAITHRLEIMGRDSASEHREIKSGIRAVEKVVDQINTKHGD